MLETVSWAAILAPLVLITRSLRRKHINKQLQKTLDQASQLQDQQKRRQVFFDIASRYARNNGCRVGLESTLDYEINIDALFGNLRANVSACDIKRLGPHNLRFSIQTSKLRKWKVWVAVDADFHVHSDDEASSSSHGPIGTDSGLLYQFLPYSTSEIQGHPPVSFWMSPSVVRSLTPGRCWWFIGRNGRSLYCDGHDRQSVSAFIILSCPLKLSTQYTIACDGCSFGRRVTTSCRSTVLLECALETLQDNHQLA